MKSKIDAIERCAYCRSYVPITPVRIGSEQNSSISARVSICDACQSGGR